MLMPTTSNKKVNMKTFHDCPSKYRKHDFALLIDGVSLNNKYMVRALFEPVVSSNGSLYRSISDVLIKSYEDDQSFYFASR